MDLFSVNPNFTSLSIKDLLEAREAYHVHLMNKANVVGTAVGLYLIRKSESLPDKDGHVAKKPDTPRTFDNSEVRSYSWPCVLVLVNDWIETAHFGANVDPSHAVPKTLYMPDGRSIPVCIVLVEQRPPDEPVPIPNAFPDYLIGGGFPLSLDVQGERRDASVGCLVTDGHTTYALTNRHVVGEAGTPVDATLRGQRVQVGEASRHQLSRLPFSDVYDAFPAQHAYLTLDVGLIRVDNAPNWTSRPYGLENVSALGDVNEENIGLALIDQPVEAYGAASGNLAGRIKALFYRYKSLGGYDYISDFLLAPEAVPHQRINQTRPGDSGTVWHVRVVSKPVDRHSRKPSVSELRPFAIEWGGQGFADAAGGTSNYMLATNLATACRLLNVDLAWGNDLAAAPFWGATGHFSIARFALTQLDGHVKSVMTANADNIAFALDAIKDGKISKQLPSLDFIPLADVPDIVWKKKTSDYNGGRDYATNKGPEHPNHFADADEPNPARNGQILRDFSLEDPTRNLTPSAWFTFYGEIEAAKDAGQRNAKADWGLLPFRVWQIFDAMVGYAKAGDAVSFVAAAGVIAHYVGDACQPLHGSYHADGYKEQATTTKTTSGTDKQVWPGQGVHSAYEDAMVDKNAATLFTGVQAKLRAKLPAALQAANDTMADGPTAALAIVTLMNETAMVLTPDTLTKAYIKLGGGASKRVTDSLWAQFGDATQTVMSFGVQTLAALWEAAWNAGTKSASPNKSFTQPQLEKLVWDADFLPSYTLEQIEPVLRAPQ
jgi:hypothetical protein